MAWYEKDRVRPDHNPSLGYHNMGVLMMTLCFLLFANTCQVGSKVLGRTRSPAFPTTALEAVMHPCNDSRLPPGDSKTTEVKIGVYIVSLNYVSTKDMSFSVTFYLRMSWKDPRLAYNATRV